MNPARLFDRLATLQHRWAVLFTIVALALAAGAVPLVMQLGLNSSFTALLPEDEPSVRDLEKVQDRVGGLNSLTVAIRSPSGDVEAMQEFASDLVPRLKELPDELAQSVDWNVGRYEQFVWEHRYLYADLKDLKEVRDKLQERLEYEKAHANPFYVDLSDEKPPDPSEIVEQMREKASKGKEKLEKFPGGYYVHPDGDLLALFVRSNLGGGDAGGIDRLISTIREHVRELGPDSYAKDLRVDFAGNLLIAREEHEAIVQELAIATTLAVSGVLLVIYIFFGRIRSIFLIGGALMVPVLVAFGFAELAVDYLNTSTAFLGSIVIGNGINPNIIWLSRYFEERRHGQATRDAIAAAHRNTWVATLTASLAAAFAYGSLVVTDFRGFRDFGIIGGVGMVLCWLGAFLVLPSMAAVLERISPFKKKSEQRAEHRRGIYGILFAKAVYAAPRPIIVVSTVLGVISVGLIGWAIAADPIEYNFKNLKSVREGSTQAKRINDRVGDIVGSSAQGNGIAVVLDSRKEAKWLEEELTRRQKEEDAPWRSVHSIYDLLPDQQEEKKPLLATIRKLMDEMRAYSEGEDREQLDKHIPPEDLPTLGPGDVPRSAARPFTEKDGTRGRILIVEKMHGESIWDGRFLVRWAEALRDVRLPDGTRPPLAGRAPVFADIISVIWTDGPKAIGASFLATCLLVLFTFRRMRQRLLTLTALLLGIAWMGGAMTLLGIKLNFLNFVAFPITFGNGVDYGVNVMRRYALEDQAGNPSAIRSAIEDTGGAVILCSLTTIIGYTSLYTSANLALNSFGSAMAISEVTCLLSAVLTVPAILLVLQRRGRGAQPSPQPQEHPRAAAE
jgi:hypothetical protein